jgi:hypothetical protein
MLVKKNQKTCTGRSFAQFEGVQIENAEMNSVKGGQGEQVEGGAIVVVVTQ